jgi:hypothetical protein
MVERVALLPRPHSPGLQSFVGQCGQLPGGFIAGDFSLAAQEDPKLPGDQAFAAARLNPGGHLFNFTVQEFLQRDAGFFWQPNL